MGSMGDEGEALGEESDAAADEDETMGERKL